MTQCWRKRDSNHWYRVMRSRFRERLMLLPLDFPSPEKSALTGDENADASRGTDGSNPVPSGGESANYQFRSARYCDGLSRGSGGTRSSRPKSGAETILAGLGTSGLTDPDSVPEVSAKPVSRLGDIWRLGKHRVGCGDSTSEADVAPVLAGAAPHLIVTDPPYGVEYDPAWRACRNQSGSRLARGPVLNDDRADWQRAYALFPGDVAYVCMRKMPQNLFGGASSC